MARKINRAPHTWFKTGKMDIPRVINRGGRRYIYGSDSQSASHLTSMYHRQGRKVVIVKSPAPNEGWVTAYVSAKFYPEMCKEANPRLGKGTLR